MGYSAPGAKTPMEPSPTRAAPEPRPLRSASKLAVLGPGLALFLFIPAVLYLFVAHPRPAGGSVGWSLAAGIGLMLGHRFLARPYMEWVRHRKCLWCNRVPPSASQPAAVPWETVLLRTATGPVEASCCTGHGQPVRRFFAFAHTWRWVLRAGIFLPLLLLLGALAASAAGATPLGRPVPLAFITDLFRLCVGLTVNLAAWGYLTVHPAAAPTEARVPFPAHNFFLLALGPLLWVFRLVGLWWIWQGSRGLVGG